MTLFPAQVLPMPDRPVVGPTTLDARDPDSSHPPIRDLRPPAGAPNILLIVLEDVGFGASSAFGGPCHTPTFERLAAHGLKDNRFHTTALCSPTRQALLTGRNHHSTSVRPNTCAPLALTLKLNGYATAQFGKCHEVPVWQTRPVGPFDAWPTGGGGFETLTSGSSTTSTATGPNPAIWPLSIQRSCGTCNSSG